MESGLSSLPRYFTIADSESNFSILLRTKSHGLRKKLLNISKERAAKL